MRYSNKDIINKGRTLATGQEHGMLNPEQAKYLWKWFLMILLFRRASP